MGKTRERPSSQARWGRHKMAPPVHAARGGGPDDAGYSGPLCQRRSGKGHAAWSKSARTRCPWKKRAARSAAVPAMQQAEHLRSTPRPCKLSATTATAALASSAPADPIARSNAMPRRQRPARIAFWNVLMINGCVAGSTCQIRDCPAQSGRSRKAHRILHSFLFSGNIVCDR